jgi:hypothetical protein
MELPDQHVAREQPKRGVQRNRADDEPEERAASPRARRRRPRDDGGQRADGYRLNGSEDTPMRYLTAAGFGVLTAIATAILWIVVAFVLPLAVPLFLSSPVVIVPAQRSTR